MESCSTRPCTTMYTSPYGPSHQRLPWIDISGLPSMRSLSDDSQATSFFPSRTASRLGILLHTSVSSIHVQNGCASCFGPPPCIGGNFQLLLAAAVTDTVLYVCMAHPEGARLGAVPRGARYTSSNSPDRLYSGKLSDVPLTLDRASPASKAMARLDGALRSRWLMAYPFQLRSTRRAPATPITYASTWT